MKRGGADFPVLRRGLALSRVASELGFTDQAYFQRHFKRRLALTPGQYQGFFRPSAPDGDKLPR
ncbi:helix-turn-helix domain-containing protein [Zobellella sp. An-6]|uniref:helix-turn-helix domain-containing protein n=1 Tax=Zobellella sp. An-6 TaxID=3400218 RepID=UPI00404358C3